MTSITLQNSTLQGKKLQATFLPEDGMKLISYKIDNTEVIAPKGGNLIGPLFKQTDSSPSWHYVNSETQIQATRKEDAFEMRYNVRLLYNGLFTFYEVRSKHPSLLGLTYHCLLPGKGEVEGEVEMRYQDRNTWKNIPLSWLKHSSHLCFDLSQKANYFFIPVKKVETDHDYRLLLETDSYSLHIYFNAISETELSYHLSHEVADPHFALSFFSSRYPEKPKLYHNILETKLELFNSA